MGYKKIAVSVFIERENRSLEVNLESGASSRDLLETLGLNPVAVLVARSGELIWEDELLKDDDQIKILSVISGG